MPPTNQVVYLGDSLMLGNHVSAGQDIPSKISAAYAPVAANASNQAIGSTYANEDGSHTDGGQGVTADGLFNSGVQRPICAVWFGANDLVTFNAATFFAAYKSYCQARTAAGYRVIACTVLPNTAITGAGHASDLATANASIRGDTSFYDALADFASDPIMGDAANNTNFTYYSDGVHPTDPGNDLLYPYLLTAIQQSLSVAYSFFRTITVDHTQVGASDSTDFPVSVVFTDTTMKPVGSGGHINHTVTSNGQTVPADLAFYADSGLTTLLAFEIESYDATAGTIVAWVKVPTISHTSDTVFYMAYDDAGTTTFQGDVNATWNSGFKGVYHVANGSALSLVDSTSGAHTLTNHNTVTATAGELGGAANFVSASSQYLSATAGFAGITALTVSFWTKGPAGSGSLTGVVSKGASGFSDFVITRSDSNTLVGTPSLFYLQNSIGGNTGNLSTTAVIWDLITQSWHHFALTWDGTTVRSYVDAVADVTGSLTGTLDNSDTVLALGAYSSANNFFDGILDEVELSSVARSADWVTATFNNQKASQTFVAVGAETPVGGSTAYTLTALGGSYAITGADVTLTKTSASMNYTLTADPGSYVITGSRVILRWSGAPVGVFPQAMAIAIMGL